MVFHVDSSAYIVSSVESPFKDGYKIHDGQGRTQEDKAFIQDFLSLSDAIHNRTEEVYETIAKKIRDINAQLYYRSGRESSGNTLLHEAVALKNVKAAGVLVANGASPDVANETGKTPRMLAADLKNDELTALFQKTLQKVERYQVISTENVKLEFDHGRLISRPSMGVGTLQLQILEIYEYKRSFRFGPEAGDHADILASISNNNGRSLVLNLTVKRIKDTTDGQMGYQIIPENDKELGLSIMSIMPDLSKYLMGKNFVFIEKKQERTTDDEGCVVS